MANEQDQVDTCRIALLGYGTVGSSLHRLLVEHGADIQRTTGRRVEVTRALVRDASTPRFGAPPLTDDMAAVLDGDVDLVCEAMGGLEPARAHVLQALRRGVPVVTANKQLVAHHGAELFAAAEQSGTQLRFEASVCGAIPIIRMLRESLAAARIDRVLGILNGTTNHMLSGMSERGTSYEDALAEAQRLGYAEPDPSDDVGGADAAAKIALLAGIAFHSRVPIETVRTTGITGVRADDIATAAALGSRVKLVGRAQRVGEAVWCDVTPMLVPTSHPLANVSGSLNAVFVTGATFDELMVQGPGAGGPQTASALAGDIVSVLGSSPGFLTRDPCVDTARIATPDALQEPFYVRMRVPDRPGVLASIAGRLAEQQVSIERVIQQRSDDETAVLVITTHPTDEPALQRALEGEDDPGLSDISVMPMLV